MASPKEQSFYQRLTRLFRTGPAIRQKIKGQDPKAYFDKSVVQNNLGYYGASAFKREASPFSVMGAYGLLDRMSRYAEFCFDGDTLVYTTTGAIKISELAEKYKNGEIFNVWSYDHNKGEIVVSTAHHPRITKDGKPQKMVKIVFDDGGFVTTTLDHKFLLRDGSYVEAKDLKPTDALMPFYMRKVTNNYHQIYMAKTNRKENDYGWKPEHVLIMENLIGRELLETEVVHHIDFNPENNNPTNLKLMSEEEHRRFHSKLNNKSKFGKRNYKHSLWMKNNNPAKRSDIDFVKIFDVANAVNFSMKKTCEILDVDMNVIKRRLREVGFENWLDFANNKGQLTTIRNASKVILEMQEPSIENVYDVVSTCKTIYEASSKLNCTENAIRRFLKRQNKTWSELKRKSFDPGTVSKNSNYDFSLSYQDICSAVERMDTKETLAKKLNTTPNKLITRLEREGYHSFNNWLENYENHKVSEVIFLDQESVVYNLTVDSHHNVAVGSLNPSDKAKERPYSMVICRQSEMEYTSEVASAMDIYADESCASDEDGRCLHVFTDNKQVRKALEELFYETANVELDMRRWIRNLVKYGDFFLYNEVVPDHGIVHVEPIPVNVIEREEAFDPADPYAVRFKLLTQGGKILENWQVTHFRLQGNELFHPYGTSFLEAARRTWRQLIMMEDAMLVYRVVRSPERRVFYIDVSGIHPNDVPSYMEAVTQTIKGQDVIDKMNGRMDIRYNAIDVNEDYFLPTRPNNLTKIDTLAGGQHVSAVEDVEYIQKKLFAALKVPKAYLTYDENLSCFVPETKVSLLDGRDLSMEEIAKELKEGKDLWTYSVNLDNNQLVPGKIIDAWEAKTADKLVKVTLDNNESFICTPEHKWLSREGKYIEAENLVAGQSLMPLYKKVSGKDTGKRNLTGYEMIYNPGTNKWEYTHSWVDRNLNKTHKVKNRRVIHHSDFNKRNNSPSNLVEMNFDDHRLLHQNILTETKKIALAMGKYSGLNNGYSKKTFNKIKHLYDYGKLIDWCKKNKPSCRKDIFKKYGLTERWFNALLTENQIDYKTFATTYMAKGYRLDRKGNKNLTLVCDSCHKEFKCSPNRGKSKKHFCSTSCRYNNPTLNHKVSSVEILNESRKVWDITVDKWHNFALANGTVVKNSKATLAQEDIRFSRTIGTLQKVVIAELSKLAIIHLFAKGFEGEDLLDFELKLSNPSTIATQQKLQIITSRLEAAAKAQEMAKESTILSEEWIQKEILKFRMDQIVEIRQQRMQEQLRMLALKKMTLPAENQKTIVDPFDPSNYSTIAGVPVSSETEQTIVKQIDKETGQQVKPEPGNTLGSSTDPKKAPVKANATPNLDNAARKRERSKEFSGNRALAMPDFKNMLDVNNRYAKDPYDLGSILEEENEKSFSNTKKRLLPNVSRDVRSALVRFHEFYAKQEQVVDLDFINEELETNNEDTPISLDELVNSFAK